MYKKISRKIYNDSSIFVSQLVNEAFSPILDSLVILDKNNSNRFY